MSPALAIGAWTNPDLEAFRLDRQRLLQVHLVALVVDQPEALQDHAERKRGLMHGEAAADAGALAVAERLPGIERPPGLRLTAEILGVEGIGVRSPDRGISVQRRHQDGGERALPELVLAAADGLVLERRDAIGRRRRPQPQRLFQDLRDVGELRHLLVGRLRIDIGAEDAIDLLVRLLENVGVLEQRIERVGQQAACGLVARDQKGVDLVADVDVVELLAGRAVDAGHHRGEHVLLVVDALRTLAALGDDLVDHLVHEGDVFRERPAALLHPELLERQAARHHDGFERAHQRFDEGMVVAPVERVEAVVEAAEADRVQRQRRHVVDDVDLVVGVEPLPFVDELLGDIDHARVIGLHGAVAEGLEQDVVRLAPVRLPGVGGEQAVAADRAHAPQRTAHGLVEALLVRELVDEIVA